MNMKKVIPIVVVLVIIIGGVVLYTSKKSTNSTNSAYTSNSSSSSTSNMPSPAPSSSQSAQATNKVTISNYSFSPATITVKKGTTVTWTNQDAVAHNVQETDGKTGPMSSDLATGKSYSYTFDTAGTYNYHCSIHPDMVAKVVVTE